MLGFITIAAIALLATGCRISIGSDDGDTVTETFDIDEFSELEVSTAFDVEIDVGSETTLEIDVDEDLVEDLDIDQEGDRLSIDIDQGFFSTSGPLRARITTPNLEALRLNGAVEVDVKGLDGDRLDLELNGASKVTGEGSVRSVTIDSDGASTVEFDDVEIEEVQLDIDGASSLQLNGAANVTGRLDGASSVDVSNSASVDVITSGASSID